MRNYSGFRLVNNCGEEIAEGDLVPIIFWSLDHPGNTYIVSAGVVYCLLPGKKEVPSNAFTSTWYNKETYLVSRARKLHIYNDTFHSREPDPALFKKIGEDYLIYFYRERSMRGIIKHALWKSRIAIAKAQSLAEKARLLSEKTELIF